MEDPKITRHIIGVRGADQTWTTWDFHKKACAFCAFTTLRSVLNKGVYGISSVGGGTRTRFDSTGSTTLLAFWLGS